MCEAISVSNHFFIHRWCQTETRKRHCYVPRLCLKCRTVSTGRSTTSIGSSKTERARSPPEQPFLTQTSADYVHRYMNRYIRSRRTHSCATQMDVKSEFPMFFLEFHVNERCKCVRAPDESKKSSICVVCNLWLRDGGHAASDTSRTPRVLS